MANPVMGEVAFSAGGREYTFKFGTYAQAILQRRSGLSTQKFFARRDDEWGADDLLLVFYAGLHQRHHLTEEQVGDLIDEIGQDRASAVMLDAVTLANKEAGGADQNPPPAEANKV